MGAWGGPYVPGGGRVCGCPHQHPLVSSRSRGRGRRPPEGDEDPDGEGEGGDPDAPPSPTPTQPPSDDPRLENMDISSDGGCRRGGHPWLRVGCGSTRGCSTGCCLSPRCSEEVEGPPSPPPPLEEDEAERELQQQLEKGRRLRQLQALREAGGPKVPP